MREGRVEKEKARERMRKYRVVRVVWSSGRSRGKERECVQMDGGSDQERMKSGVERGGK